MGQCIQSVQTNRQTLEAIPSKKSNLLAPAFIIENPIENPEISIDYHIDTIQAMIVSMIMVLHHYEASY